MPINNSSNYQVTQYNVITGGASNVLNNVAPGASGTVLTSNGASSQPTFQAVASTIALGDIITQVYQGMGA